MLKQFDGTPTSASDWCNQACQGALLWEKIWDYRLPSEEAAHEKEANIYSETTLICQKKHRF